MRRHRAGARAGFSLIELVIVVAIVGILASATMPLARWGVKRNREYQLQQSLRILRNAIDRYHDAAAAGIIEVPEGGSGYPPTLEALVEGVPMLQELPAPVPPVAGEYAASGPGLTGGIAGMMQQQAEAMGGGAPDNPSAVASGGSREPGLALGARPGQSPQLGASGIRVGTSPQQSGTGFSLDRGSRPPGLSTPRQGTGALDAPAQPLLGPDGQPLKLVFLRRIPVDPFTGSAEWGTRCYGEPPDDRLWCGKDVFDVFSKSVARAIDGSNYRDW